MLLAAAALFPVVLAADAETGSIHLRFIAADTGKPISGGSIVLQNGFGRWTGATDSDGVFSADGLHPVFHLLHFSARGYGSLWTGVMARPGDSPVHLVQLPPAGTLAGTVVNAAGEPVSGARIFLWGFTDAMGPPFARQAHGGQEKAASGPDGTFEITGPTSSEFGLPRPGLAAPGLARRSRRLRLSQRTRRLERILARGHPASRPPVRGVQCEDPARRLRARRHRARVWRLADALCRG